MKWISSYLRVYSHLQVSEKTIKGEKTSIEDIRNNPNAFKGKQVVIESVGAGVNISMNIVLEKALKKLP